MRSLEIFGVLALSGCNLIFGLEDAQDRPGGGNVGGDGLGGQAPGGDGGGASDPSGGGGSDPSGGSGTSGGGGGACPPELPAKGTELVPNGSFEDGTLDWVASDLISFSVVDKGSACGCRAAEVQIGDGYGELRGILAPPAGGMVHARARVYAEDNVAVGLMLRVNNNPVGQAPDFPPDVAGNDEDDDGWRTLEYDWNMPAGTSALLAIQVDGTPPAPSNQEILVDCISLTADE